eukprot:jgi/Mesvir1/14900/Mv05501-RA.1
MAEKIPSGGKGSNHGPSTFQRTSTGGIRTYPSGQETFSENSQGTTNAEAASSGAEIPSIDSNVAPSVEEAARTTAVSGASPSSIGGVAAGVIEVVRSLQSPAPDAPAWGSYYEGILRALCAAVLLGDLAENLAPTQLFGVAWLLVRELGGARAWRGGILADEMGLGKTLQMLLLMALNRVPTLLVCPIPAMAVWEDEIRKWFKEGTFKVFRWHRRDKVKVPLADLPPNAVVICPPGTMTSDIVEAGKALHSGGEVTHTLKSKSELRQVSWGRIVIDEAQCIKNAGTAAFFAACQLAASSRFAITGTPVENSPDEFLSPLRFLCATPYCDRRAFASRVARARGPVGRPKAERARTDLRAMFPAVMLRRPKSDLVGAALPVKHMALIRVPLTETEERAHASVMSPRTHRLTRLLRSRMVGQELPNEAAKEARKAVRATLPENVENFSAKRLRYEASRRGVTLAESGQTPKQLYRGMLDALVERHIVDTASKWQAIRELLDDIWEGGRRRDFVTARADAGGLALGETESLVMDTNGETKVLMFDQWPKLSFHFAELMLMEMGMGEAYRRIDGEVPQNRRVQEIEAFRNDKDVKVLLLGLKSGNASINLQVAQVAVFNNLWWNAATEEQAINRIHRVGSTHKHNYIFKLVSDGSEEERVLDTQQRKQQQCYDKFLSLATNSISGVAEGPCNNW